MIVEVLNTGSTSSRALKYNYNKFFAGLADIVDHRNLPDATAITVPAVFEKYESNERIARQARNLSLHLAFNPSEEELQNVGEEKILSFIRELMDRLGYSEQPTVVFRHMDIPRRHYHLIAPKVDKDGKIIANNFDYYKIPALVREIGAAYGLSLPKKEKWKNKTPDEEVVKKLHFSASVSQYTENNIRFLFEKAYEFDFRSEEEFADILRSMNLLFTSRKSRKDPSRRFFSVQGLNSKGEIVTKPLRIFDWKKNGEMSDEIHRRAAEARKHPRKLEPRVKISEIIRYCYKRAGSAEELKSIVSEVGLDCVVKRDGAGRLLSLSVVDRKEGMILSCFELEKELGIKSFKEMELSGIWKIPGVGDRFGSSSSKLSEYDIDTINMNIERRLLSEKAKMEQRKKSGKKPSKSLKKGE